MRGEIGGGEDSTAFDGMNGTISPHPGLLRSPYPSPAADLGRGENVNDTNDNNMNDSELLESLIYSTLHAAGFVLKRMRRIPPAGLYFKNPDDPRMDYYFPTEDQPKAGDEELRRLVEEKLRRWAARPETCAVAFVTEVVADGQRMMALQAETRSRAVVLHYPIRKTWLGLKLGEGQEADGLLLERLLGETRAT